MGLAMVIVSAMGANTGWAYEEPSTLPENFKFYGRANISFQRDHDFDKTANPANNEIIQNTNWHSNASRVGVKGKFTLDPNWSLFYKGELEVDANSGYNSNNNFIERREVYAGVSNKKLGTVMGGKIDTPLKMLQSKVDMFGDLTAGDMKYLVKGKTRDSYTYLYMTPTFAGLTASVATINFREEPNTPNLAHNSGSSMSLTYTASKLLTPEDEFYAGAARNINVLDYTIDRFAMQYKWSAFTVGGLIQSAEKTAPGKRYSTGYDTEDGHFLNAAWNFTDKDTVKVQWGQSQEVENSGTQKAIGYDHKINKNLKVYVFHAGIGGDYYQSNTPAKQTDRTLMSNGVGFQYDF